MNKPITSILALLALCAAPAMAVPAGINYQGALTDDQGNPITGTRTMSIKLYDAATDGTLLYSEDMGEVDVSDGVFSFEFGAGGTSNAQQTETVAITDGTATSFQKVLSHPVIVVGMGISVTDGTYTWSQSGGSSNEDDFSVVYSTNLRRVTVNYLNGAPAAGRTITATYRTPASGISGALVGDNQPWAEITVDGVAQVPRQKVLTVPFAAVADTALRVSSTAETLMLPFQSVTRGVEANGNSWGSTTTVYSLPSHIKDLEGASFSYVLSKTSTTSTPSNEGAYISLAVIEVSPQSNSTKQLYVHNDQLLHPSSGTFTKTVYVPALKLNTSSNYYRVEITIGNNGSHTWGSRNYGQFLWMRVDHAQ